MRSAEPRVFRMRRGPVCAALGVGLMLLTATVPNGAAAPAGPTPDALIAQLDAERQQCIAAAHSQQQRERTIGALDLAVGVIVRGAEAKEKEIEQSRKDQEQLLAALERLARAPPEALAFSREGPVDRVRSGILIAAAVPALQAQARTLSGQLAALANVRTQIEARRGDVDQARQALVNGSDALAGLVTRRNELIGQLLHDDGKAPGGGKIAEQASDTFDLIKRADAATEQQDKELFARLRMALPAAARGAAPVIDPTRPKTLRALDAPRATMLWPVSGELAHRFGEADPYGRPSQGVTINGLANGVVIAPFDGRVAFVGTFRGYGLILIIRHGGGYHSLLAGLGHADVTIGQWLLAGEPVGVVPGADDKNAITTVYLELRREGRSVDPQSRLASRDEKTEENRVSE